MTKRGVVMHCLILFFFFVFFFLAKDTDIIDEAIYYFKANVFFKNYEIKVIFFSFAIVPLLRGNCWHKWHELIPVSNCYQFHEVPYSLTDEALCLPLFCRMRLTEH